MKRPLIRLVVAVVSFLAALVELALRLVQLATLLVERATKQLQGLVVEAPAPKASARPRPTLVSAPAPPAAPAPPDAEARLVGALTGPSLGFRVGPARAFAATVRTRLVTEPMDGLVREGIVHLSASN